MPDVFTVFLNKDDDDDDDDDDKLCHHRLGWNANDRFF